MLRPALAAIALSLGSASAAAPPPSSAALPAPLPFSESVRVGDVLYLSGQIGAAPGVPGPVAGGLVPEARQAMDNIARVLRANGLAFRDVFKCTVMLTDMRQWGDFNRVYLGYFAGQSLPARSAIGASGLALGAQVEVECLARFPVATQPTAARPVDAARMPPLGPYSTAVMTGNLVFVSGVVPHDAARGAFTGGDFPGQMRQALANLDTALQSAGVGRGDVVKTTVFLRNAADMAAMNTAYAAYFGGTRPARTTVPGVDWGRDDLLVEIEAIAAIPGDVK